MQLVEKNQEAVFVQKVSNKTFKVKIPGRQLDIEIWNPGKMLEQEIHISIQILIKAVYQVWTETKGNL